MVGDDPVATCGGVVDLHPRAAAGEAETRSRRTATTQGEYAFGEVGRLLFVSSLGSDRLPFLDAMVNETLRVYAAGCVPRLCLKDTLVRTIGKSGKVSNVATCCS